MPRRATVNMKDVLLKLEEVVPLPTPALPAHTLWRKVEFLDAFDVLGACDAAWTSTPPEFWAGDPPDFWKPATDETP